MAGVMMNGMVLGVLMNGMMAGVRLDGTKVGNNLVAVPRAHFSRGSLDLGATKCPKRFA